MEKSHSEALAAKEEDISDRISKALVGVKVNHFLTLNSNDLP